MKSNNKKYKISCKFNLFIDRTLSRVYALLKGDYIYVLGTVEEWKRLIWSNIDKNRSKMVKELKKMPIQQLWLSGNKYNVEYNNAERLRVFTIKSSPAWRAELSIPESVLCEVRLLSKENYEPKLTSELQETSEYKETSEQRSKNKSVIIIKWSVIGVANVETKSKLELEEAEVIALAEFENMNSHLKRISKTWANKAIISFGETELNLDNLSKTQIIMAFLQTADMYLLYFKYNRIIKSKFNDDETSIITKLDKFHIWSNLDWRLNLNFLENLALSHNGILTAEALSQYLANYTFSLSVPKYPYHKMIISYQIEEGISCFIAETHKSNSYTGAINSVWTDRFTPTIVYKTVKIFEGVTVEEPEIDNYNCFYYITCKGSDLVKLLNFRDRLALELGRPGMATYQIYLVDKSSEI